MMKSGSSKGLVTSVFFGDSVENYLSRHFGERFKEYRRLWQLPVDTGEALSFPIHIDFELNDSCNQKCRICPRNDDHRQLYPVPVTVNTGRRLSFNDFCRVIDETASKGTVSINVGAYAEPLIHPDIIRMINYARDHGIMDIILFTNALLLNEKMSEAIMTSGVTRICVSIDAYKPDTYRLIRGHGFEIVKKNLMRFMQMRGPGTKGLLPWVRVSFVEMADNASEKSDFIGYWQDKVDFVEIQKYTRPDLVIAPDVLKKAKYSNCIEPWRRVAVRANGDILPCCTFIADVLKLGNIENMTIEEAWKSRQMQRVRESILKDTLGVCAACQRG